jgi:alpha-tubulin suppressor-like RCC1 family protein
MGGSGKLGNGADTLARAPVLVVGGSNFAVVSAGAGHTCAVTTTGAAYCWGENAGGQLGIGAASASHNTPQPVAGGHSFRMISAGFNHTCGVTTAGELYCWGSNNQNQLGDGSTTPRPAPVLIPVPS